VSMLPGCGHVRRLQAHTRSSRINIRYAASASTLLIWSLTRITRREVARHKLMSGARPVYVAVRGIGKQDVC
jgi:hypothetical protein